MARDSKIIVKKGSSIDKMSLVSQAKEPRDGYYVAYKLITLSCILFMFIEMKFIHYHSCVIFVMMSMNICND